MEEKLDWFKWFPRDWLLDEDVTNMTLEQQGAYFRLLCHQWCEGSVPEDPGKLARILHVHWRSARAIWSLIEYKFEILGPGVRGNKRLHDLRKEASEHAQERRKSGSKGGQEKAKRAKSLDRVPSSALASENRREESREEDNTPHTPQGGLFQLEPEKPKPKAKKKPTFVPHPDASRVLLVLNEARARVIRGCRPLAEVEENLRYISGRLLAGNSVDDCRHVISVREAEVRANPESAKWFNAVTTFRPDNFALSAAQTISAASKVNGHGPRRSLGSNFDDGCSVPGGDDGR